MLYVNLLFLPNQQKVLSILKLFAKLRKDSGKGGKPTHGEGMKIGQVAQRYSISRDNLYYYINYGLLVPPRMDKQYVFDDETLNDLERILELKELGFTLAKPSIFLSTASDHINIVQYRSTFVLIPSSPAAHSERCRAADRASPPSDGS